MGTVNQCSVGSRMAGICGVVKPGIMPDKSGQMDINF